jgi:S1-C subfamily serine protease
MAQVFRRSALGAVVTLLVALAGTPAHAAEATPEEKAAAVVAPSVVYIEMHWSAWVRVPASSGLFFQGYVNDGQPFAWGTRCSGFVVNPAGYVVTAGHCVDEGEQGARGTALEFAVRWLIDQGWARQRDFGFWLNEAHLSWGVEGKERGTPADRTVSVQRGVAAGGVKTGDAFPARVVEYESIDDGDVALLKIEETDLPAIQIAGDADIAIGTDVLSVGYPGSSDAVTDASYEPTFKDGQINSKKTREGGLLPVYEMSAALSGGMSGGPTVDLDGNVVGVNSFNIVGETEAFNFITPSSLVTEMLARNGVENELGPTDQAYRAGLDAYFAGDYRTAVRRFDEVLAISPTHQQAQEYRVLAAKEAAKQPRPSASRGSGGGLPILPIAGGVVLLGLVAGALVMRGRRGAGPAETPPATTGVPPVASIAGEPLAAAEPEALVGDASPNGTAPAEQTAGVAVASRSATPHFCSNCGQGVSDGARFCANCGHAIGD